MNSTDRSRLRAALRSAGQAASKSANSQEQAAQPQQQCRSRFARTSASSRHHHHRIEEAIDVVAQLASCRERAARTRAARTAGSPRFHRATVLANSWRSAPSCNTTSYRLRPMRSSGALRRMFAMRLFAAARGSRLPAIFRKRFERAQCSPCRGSTAYGSPARRRTSPVVTAAMRRPPSR